MGKDLHSRWARVIFDEYNLSGDSLSLGNIGMEFEEDGEGATTFSDGVVNYVCGRPSLIADGYNALFNPDSVSGGDSRDGAFTALKARAEWLVSVLLGEAGEPAAGDIAYSAPLEQLSFQTAGDLTIAATVTFAGAGQGYTLIPRVFGKVLDYGDLTIGASSTYSGTSVDNGASTSAGATAYLHVIAAASAGLTIKVEHSSDDSTWADLLTFTTDGSAKAVEQKQAAGTVDRYTRISVANGTGSQETITLACTLIREQ